MKKRILGLLLALSMIVGLLPMIALAEEADETTATLVVSSGSNATATPETDTPSWEPALSEGMAPAYAKTTTEGIVTTEGASDSDWNLKVEWTTGGTPTLTLKNATINNNNRYVGSSSNTTSVKKDTIKIGGTADFVIVVEGTNTLNGSPDAVSALTSAYRCPFGILAANRGTLTITGESKATASLTINSVGGYSIVKQYNALTIENVSMTIAAVCRITETSDALNSYVQKGIVLAYMEDGLEDSTNLTVENANLTLDMGNAKKNYGFEAIALGKANDAYSAANTGDIRFINSTVNATRYSNSSSTPLIRASSAVIIDRSDVFVTGVKWAIESLPVITNYASATYTRHYLNDENKDAYETDVVYDPAKGGTAVDVRVLNVTHACGAANDDFDCTTPTTCDMCGEALGSSQSTHNNPGDDGDCTTPIVCANNGCNVVLTPAATGHVANDDDGDCTTAVTCKNEGCEHIMTPAASSHTSPPDRTSCDQAANCTVCNKALAVGEHTGGTATCQAKAVCAVCSTSYGELGTCAGGTATCTAKAVCATCGNPYGELAAHTPEEDDGDCTTAVKCSVCQGEAVAAKTHTFTDATDTLCDNAGCTHTRVLEPKPDFLLSFATRDKTASDPTRWYGVPSGTGEATLIMKAGDATKYYKNCDSYEKVSYMVETTDTTNWNMKVEYAADGIPTVTLKGAKFDAKESYSLALLFGGCSGAVEGPVKLVVEADSIIDGGYNSNSFGALNYIGAGEGSSLTITGPGKLIVTGNSNAAGSAGSRNVNDVGILSVDNADLILDNANLAVLVSEYYGPSHGIAVDSGDMTIIGGNVRVIGWDNPDTTHAEGKESGHSRINNTIYSGIFVSKTDENAADGNLLIEGGANVTVATSTMLCNNNMQAVVYTDGEFTIKDSTVEIGLVGRTTDAPILFDALPTLQFADNKYTVIATKSSKPDFSQIAVDFDPDTYDGTMTYKENKVVDPYAEGTSLTSLTYFKVSAGGSTGTSGGSNPNTGDSMNLVLWFSLLAVSAAGFATVLVIYKKKFVA